MAGRTLEQIMAAKAAQAAGPPPVGGPIVRSSALPSVGGPIVRSSTPTPAPAPAAKKTGAANKDLFIPGTVIRKDQVGDKSGVFGWLGDNPVARAGKSKAATLVGGGLKVLGATGEAGMAVIDPILTEARQAYVQGVSHLPDAAQKIMSADPRTWDPNAPEWTRSLRGILGVNAKKELAEMKAGGVHGFRLSEMLPGIADKVNASWGPQSVSKQGNPINAMNTSGAAIPEGWGSAGYIAGRAFESAIVDPQTWISGGTTTALRTGLTRAGQASTVLGTGRAAVATRKGLQVASRLSAKERTTEFIAEHGGAMKASPEAMATALTSSKLRNVALQDPKIAQAMEDVGIGSKRTLTVGLGRGNTYAIPGTTKIVEAADKLWTHSVTSGPIVKVSDFLSKAGVGTASGQMLKEAVRSGDVTKYREARGAIQASKLASRLAPETQHVWTTDALKDLAADETAPLWRPEHAQMIAEEQAKGLKGRPVDVITKDVNKQLNQLRRDARRLPDSGAGEALAVLDPNQANPQTKLAEVFDRLHTYYQGKMDETILLGEMSKKDPSLDEAIAGVARGFDSLGSNLEKLGEKSTNQGLHYLGNDALGLLMKHGDQIASLNAGMRAAMPLYDDGMVTDSILAMAGVKEAAARLTKSTQDNAAEFRATVAAQKDAHAALRSEMEVEKGVKLGPVQQAQLDRAQRVFDAQARLQAKALTAKADEAAKIKGLQGRAADIENVIRPEMTVGAPLKAGPRSVPKGLLEGDITIAGEQVYPPHIVDAAAQLEVKRLEGELYDAEQRLGGSALRPVKPTTATGEKIIVAPTAAEAPSAAFQQGLLGEVHTGERTAAEADVARLQGELAQAKSRIPEVPGPVIGPERTMPAPAGLVAKSNVQKILTPEKGKGLRTGVDAFAFGKVISDMGEKFVGTGRVAPEDIIEYRKLAKAAMDELKIDPEKVQVVKDLEKQMAAKNLQMKVLPRDDLAGRAAIKEEIKGLQRQADVARNNANISVDKRKVLPYINPRSTPKTIEEKTQQLFGVAKSSMADVYTETQLRFITALERLASLGEASPLADAQARMAALAEAADDIRATGKVGEQARQVEAAALSARQMEDTIAYKAEEASILEDLARGLHAKAQQADAQFNPEFARIRDARRPDAVNVVSEALRRPGVGEEIGKQMDKAADFNKAGKLNYADMLAHHKELLQSDAYGGLDMDSAFLHTTRALEQQQLLKMSRPNGELAGYIDPKLFQFIARTTLGPMNVKAQLSNFAAVTNLWRAWQIARPGFSNRNFYGILANNSGWGVTLKDYSEAAKTFKNYDGWRTLIRNGLMNPEDGSEAALAYKAFMGTKNGRLYAEHMDAWASQIGEGVVQGQPGEPSHLMNAAHKMSDFWQNVGERPKVPGFVPFVGGKDILNPFDVRAFVTTAGGGQVWRDVPVEVNGRLALLMRLKEGKSMSDEGASSIVDAMHFDYQDLGKNEVMLKRYIPFYTFRARNIPLQAELLARGIGPNRAILNMTMQSQRDNEQMGGRLPNFLNGINLPFGGGGVFAATALPFNDFLGSVNTAALALTGNEAHALDDVAAQLAPQYKSLIQLGTGRETLTHRQIGAGKSMGMAETLARNIIPLSEYIKPPKYGSGDRKYAFRKVGSNIAQQILYGVAAEMTGVSPGTIRHYEQPTLSGS